MTEWVAQRTALLLACSVLACGRVGSDPAVSSEAPPLPTPECADRWSSATTTALVDTLERATSPGPTVWTGFHLERVSVGIYAGRSSRGGHCLGLWRSGRAVGYAELGEAPAWLTPMFGYHLSYEPGTGAMVELLDNSRQPQPVGSWLERSGVDNAVIVPAVVENLPFEVSTMTKVQIAIHEAFHVEVQAGQWVSGHTDRWPAWDRQPDRVAVQACYSAESGNVDVVPERDALADLVTALLDQDTPRACLSGRRFLEERSARYAALTDVVVPRHDGTDGTCGEAEAIMELEEGVADYASWVLLFERGFVSRLQLLQRYRAQQSEWFYVTGSMQLHAARLLQPDGIDALTARLATSESWSSGSLTSALEESLAEVCTTR